MNIRVKTTVTTLQESSRRPISLVLFKNVSNKYMYRRMKKISQVHRHFEAIDTVFTKIGRTYSSDRWRKKKEKRKKEREKQVRIHEISRSPARLCPPKKEVTDRPTDGRTHPLIESWLTTKNRIPSLMLLFFIGNSKERFIVPVANQNTELPGFDIVLRRYFI